MTNTDTANTIQKPAPAKPPRQGSANPSAPSAPASRSNERSKIDKVLALLNRSGGATLDDMVKATGWLPHTTRAALTGLKKMGRTVERTKTDGMSRYTLILKSDQ